MEYCDVKRVFVSSKFAQGSLEDIVRKAFVPEVGMSFKAFKRLLGNISAIKFLDENRDLEVPLSRFTAFIYELCIVHLTEFKNVIMKHDFQKDLKLKEGKNHRKKKGNYYIKLFFKNRELF